MSSAHESKLYTVLIRELEDFAVFVIGLDGRIDTWNPGVERFLGYSEAEFIGKNMRDLFTPEDQSNGAPEQEMESARRNGRAADVRWHVCKNQSRVFVEGVIVALIDGEMMGYAKILRALHPRQNPDSMLSTILEGTEDAIYAVDREGRFIFANEKTARLFNRTVDRLMGQTREDLWPSQIAADLRETDNSILKNGQPRLVEERLPTKQGERVLLINKAPWRSTGGNIGLVAIAKDITARTALATERERLLREVRRVNEELSSFSHVVAHDLRTPLRAVRTYTELLERHAGDHLDQTAQHFITLIKDGAENMDHLVQSLLQYAESGEDLSLQSVDLNAVLTGLLARIAPVIQEAGAIIAHDPLPQVQADPVRLLQVFQNLLMNAINYRGDSPPRVHIAAEPVADDYQFAIADNGIGIPPDQLERIFAPLHRLHAHKDIHGSGLGLAVCRKIIERHGGRIWVESMLGKGSTFFFTLPIASI
jgi:PAS domain S-box-containing protein